MKHSKYIFIILVLVFMLVSCKKDFLEVEDRNSIIAEQFVVDLATTEQYLNGVHAMTALMYNDYDIIYPELIADNVKLNTASASVLNAHYYWTQAAGTSSAVNMNTSWSGWYKAIRMACYAIEKADEFRSENAVKADNIKAQAYGFRALGHFMLVNMFAQSYNFTTDASHPGMPYITSGDWTQPVTQRNTVAEVYANMIADLSTSISLFGNAAVNPQLMNRNAAKALLARVYLFKGDFANAKNLAREISIAVPIMTGSSNYPSKLFTPQETEALFQVAPQLTLTNYFGRHLAGSAARFFASTGIKNLLNQYPADLRNVWIKTVSGRDSIKKYPSNVVPGFSSIFASFYPSVIRSSEMYLTAAEAYAQLGMTDSAQHFVNAIRVRANIPALPVSVTGTALLDSIYIERRKELSFEGLRMYDLLRWKKGVTRTDPWTPGAQNLPYPSDKAIAPIHATDASIIGFSQNPGY
jgi:starch-binding outer membrane protein, SusD/RagB family